MTMSTGTIPIPIVRCASTVGFGRKSRRRCNVTTAMATATSTTGRGSSQSTRRDYYTVLSLEHRPDVGAEEIRRAYRRLALRHHPDVCPPSRRAESTALFLELRRAYETLSDPARRVRYDAGLRTDDDVDGGDQREVVARRHGGGGVALARSVWESQLCVLRARSEQRQRARSSTQAQRRRV